MQKFWIDLDKLKRGDGCLAFFYPATHRAVIERALQVPEPAKYMFVYGIEKKKKPRTTGWRSQNHRINGHIQVICKDTGDDFDFMKAWLKHKAIRRGYPFDTAPDGIVIPWSESRLNTVQAGYLCDEINQFAAENNIRLPEYPDQEWEDA